MSYSIEYNRQFIRTSAGYIPMVLIGDNNVYDGNRRARSWCVPFKGLFNKTEEEMLEHMKEHFNEYDQHWKRGSKWISNSGLLAWIRSGCASACSLEEFLVFNPHAGFQISLMVYDKAYNSTEVLRECPKTTAELDAWCQKADAYLLQNCSGSSSWYYRVGVLGEDIFHPPVGDGVFALKCTPTLYYVKPGEAAANPMFALLLSAKEWVKEISANPLFSYHGQTPYFEKINDRDVFIGKAGYILRVDSGIYAGRYMKAAVKRHCYMCFHPSAARRYATEAGAKTAKKNIEFRYPALAGCLKIEEIKEDEKNGI